jgi:hypothetical protein
MNHSNNNDLVLKEIKIDGSAKSFIYEKKIPPNLLTKVWRAILRLGEKQC